MRTEEYTEYTDMERAEEGVKEGEGEKAEGGRGAI